VKLYQCHKRVRAGKIRGIEHRPAAGVVIHLEDGSLIAQTSSWYSKHLPSRGGYLVAYEDGYTSFSPAEAFEAGYTEVAE
jgi:hypothetical protein